MTSHNRSRAAARLTGAATVVAALGCAELMGRLGKINRFILPLPSDIIETLDQDVLADVVHSFFLTLAETFAAILLAVLISVPIGWLFYRYDLVRRVNEVFVAAMASAPLILLYPLFLVVLGRGVKTVIVISALAGSPAVILKVSDGLRGIRPVLLNVGRTFHLSPWQMFLKVELPSAAPTIFNGVRLALMVVLINTVAIEFLINIGGLGRLIADLADLYEIPAMYAVIMIVLVISAVFLFLTERLEKWLRPA